MKFSISKENTLPQTLIPGRVYFTDTGIYVANSETESKQYSSRINLVDVSENNNDRTIKDIKDLVTDELIWIKNSANAVYLEDNTNIQDAIAELRTINASKTLVLRAYIFGVSGTYTKDQLESLLNTTLDSLITSIGHGCPIIIFSKDNTTANISFVIESNYTLTSDGELNTLTLMWHQYQLWNTLSVTRNTDGSFTLTNTTE